MLLLFFRSTGDDSDTFERYIRVELVSTPLTASGTDDNDISRVLTPALGPLLPRLPLGDALQ